MIQKNFIISAGYAFTEKSESIRVIRGNSKEKLNVGNFSKQKKIGAKNMKNNSVFKMIV